MSKIYYIFILYTAFSSALFISCNDNGVTDNTPPAPKDTTIQLNDSLLHHAYITDFYPNANFKNDNDFAALAWMINDTPYIGRTVFRFNLSVIPQSATVKDAHFLLNYDQIPFHYSGAGHHQDSGSNASYMQRITQDWTDSTVTWFNQPAVTSANQITLDASTSQFQNYSVDMTAAINDMVKNPAGNYGFLFRLKTESPLRVLGFSSGDGNSNIKPVLQITYTPSK